jgi:hypothetical protein
MEQKELSAAIPTTESDAVVTAADTQTATAEQTNLQPAEMLTVKFNKQAYQLSKEEAVNYAQMGMKYHAVEPLLSKLKTVAAGTGQSLADYVDSLCGEPVDTDERLAREFCQLRETCPDVERFDQLPEAVVRQAAEHGTPLTFAYLQYHYGETQKIRRAQAAAKAAADGSAGSQKGEPQGAPDPAVEAMIRGIWS